MEQQFNSETENIEKTKTNKFFWIAGLILVIIAAIYLLYGKNLIKPAGKPTESPAPELSGKIYLSLMPKISSGPDNVSVKLPPVDLYVFDLKTKQLEKLFSGSSSNSSDIDNFTVRFSPDGKKAAFVSNRHDTDRDFDEIYVMNADSTGIQRLTNSDITDKQLPTWSPDSQLLAYTALIASSTPESASVRILNLNGEDRFLTLGAYPLFSPDGKQILVLKDRGLFLINLSDGMVEEPPVFNICGQTKCSLNIKINLSQDKKFLVWTDFYQGKIGILKINNWSPFQADLIKEIVSIYSFWPAFSSDNRFLAAQEIEITNGQVGKIVLAAYNLTTLEKQVLTDLSPYYSGFIWLTDWR